MGGVQLLYTKCSVDIVLDFIQTVWIFNPYIFCWDFIKDFLFDISCISDHVQPILKTLLAVFAECGHFVVTWYVHF